MHYHERVFGISIDIYLFLCEALVSVISSALCVEVLAEGHGHL